MDIYIYIYLYNKKKQLSIYIEKGLLKQRAIWYVLSNGEQGVGIQSVSGQVKFWAIKHNQK